MKAQIAATIHRYGEPVEYTPQGGSTMFLTASVQSPVMDPLVNDLDMAWFLVYFAPDDIPAPPKKFDRITIRGKVRALDEDAVSEYYEGIPIAYIARVRG